LNNLHWRGRRALDWIGLERRFCYGDIFRKVDLSSSRDLRPAIEIWGFRDRVRRQRLYHELLRNRGVGPGHARQQVDPKIRIEEEDEKVQERSAARHLPPDRSGGSLEFFMRSWNGSFRQDDPFARS
jgi:hypothetical protein